MLLPYAPRPSPWIIAKVNLASLCLFLNVVQAVGRRMMFLIFAFIYLVIGWACMLGYVCHQMTTCRRQVSPCNMWGMEIKRMSLDLAVNEPLNHHTGP